MRSSGFKVFLAGILSAVLFMETPSAVFAADANENPTADEVINLVNTYDSDAAQILNTMTGRGDDITSWIGNGVVTSVDTSVHEEFHRYTIYLGRYGNSSFEYNYYLGNGQNLYVPETEVLKTEEATGDLASEYQTDRYSLYVSEGASASANKDGVYGLLDEFAAYYWGGHAASRLYPYLATFCETATDWRGYITDFLNERNAYAEFYCWTLLSLEETRTSRPDIYQKLLANTGYVEALRYFEESYRNMLAEFEDNISEICLDLNGAAFEESYRDGVVDLGRVGLYIPDDYDTLLPLINDSSFDTVKSDFGIQDDSAGWVRDSVGWWYRHEDGSWTSNGWELIDNEWYYFDGTGYCHTGWLKDGSYWYYLDPESCAMQTGWVEVSGTWYYLAEQETPRHPLGSMYASETTPDGHRVDASGAYD